MVVPKQTRGNPYERAGFLSRTFFCWTLPFFIRGYKKELEEDDLYDCAFEDTSEYLGDALQRQWDKEVVKQRTKTKYRANLRLAIIKTFGGAYLLNSVICLFEECFTRVFQPVCLGWVVRYFNEPERITKVECYLAAGGVCLLAFFYVITHHPLFFGMLHVGMKIRIAACTLIYKKALKLSQKSIGKTTVGQMVNLLSNDVNRFDQSVIYLAYLVVGPLQTVIIVAILWQSLGVACISGLVVLILCIPLQAFMGKIFSKLRGKTAALTDERVRLMNEIISGIQVIKMYAWEVPFAKLVDLARRKEIRKIKGTSVLRGFNIALFFAASKVIVFICFVTFVLMGNKLSAEIVFVSMSLYNNLRLSMTLFFPFAIAQWAETGISIQRIQKFLEHEEQEESSSVDNVKGKVETKNCGIWVDNASARWSSEIEEPTLKHITFAVKPGELLVVVGSVGAGKTSLLMTLLGELPTTEGKVKMSGKIAYASQEPWVFSGTVQQNVLFGLPLNQTKYDKVLQVCALDKDVKQFPHGDQTLVGERGVSLSGGQKARVNLARSLYRDGDIYLLDDPLSAVDIAVAKHLFDRCINGYLKDKARVLITHQVQFLRSATKILILKEGKCFALGSYEQLISQGVDLMSMLAQSETRIRSDSVGSSGKEDIMACNVRRLSPTNSLYRSVSSLSSSVSIEEDTPGVLADPNDAPRQKDETRTQGSVKGEIYWKYIKAGAGPFMILFLICTQILTQFIYSGSDYWLALWTNYEEAKSNRYHLASLNDSTTPLTDTNMTEASTYELMSSTPTMGIYENVSTTAMPPVHKSMFLAEDTYTNIYIYTGLMVALFLLSLIRTTAFFVVCMQSSVRLHNTMFKSITRAPMEFFDSNPVGRVLNRFTKDLGLIDDLLPFTFFDIITILLSLLGIMTIVISVNWFVSAPTVGLTILFIMLRRFYIRTARDVKRLEGITRSPVFSHLATSLHGITTIRAFGVEREFEKDFCAFQDHHTSSWFILMGTARWFGVILDLLTVAYISFVTVFLLAFNEGEEGGNVGLAISSSLLLSGMFQWGVRQSAELESQMTAVERVVEYSNLKPEAPLESAADKKPPDDWPKKGEITFDNMSLYYSINDSPVLKNLSCHIEPKEKIGIVGRTGAGKSSMITSLFRMTEPDGSIIIDEVATKDIGLHDLRSRISIIPQDPVLFTAQVRRNIDPFGKTSDSELWAVLDEVQLKEVVQELPGGLDAMISEGGGNFSVGQRQLICLARAILRKNTILVLDEATANVDHRTDSLIQNTIREKFLHCTVLTIAHRLNTIMDSDRVLVLDAGRILEFDEPYQLLQNPESHFREMVQQTGREMSEKLKATAQQAHNLRLRAKAKSESIQNGTTLINRQLTPQNSIPNGINDLRTSKL